MDTKNLAIVRQSYANTVFTHQVQEIAATRARHKAFWVKIINIVLVFIVLVLLVLQTRFPHDFIYSYLGAGLTIAEVAFLIVQLTFDFGGQSLTHKNAGLKYMGLRDRYRLLITDIMSEKSPKKELVAQRNALQAEYQSISDLAPPTSQEDFEEAQVRLNKRGKVNGEQFTWSDTEIDHFLPEELRLTGKKKK